MHTWYSTRIRFFVISHGLDATHSFFMAIYFLLLQPKTDGCVGGRNRGSGGVQLLRQPKDGRIYEGGARCMEQEKEGGNGVVKVKRREHERAFAPAAAAHF